MSESKTPLANNFSAEISRPPTLDVAVAAAGGRMFPLSANSSWFIFKAEAEPLEGFGVYAFSG